MRYHLIAIGGSVMHNLAIDLKDIGHVVSGSDDEIYEPSRSRLESHGLLPHRMGWDSSIIDESIDAIILGKHAKEDNPELQKALSLNLTIYSFPEFFALHSRAGNRVCIAGSHGKTTTTSVVMHVLKLEGLDFDYLVGAGLDGFDKMVKMSGADIMVVEGDEYPSSCLDSRAKMLHYDPTISVITGVAWDHVNIYKSYESYLAVFDEFISKMNGESTCYFDQNDKELLHLMIEGKHDCQKHGYLPFETNAIGDIVFRDHKYPIEIFGKHNMSNLKAAFYICQSLGISGQNFFNAIKTFKGASKRLEEIYNNGNMVIYRDFAHAPSKCKASCAAVREKYPEKRILGFIELHTFSSLNRSFINHYKNTMNALDKAIVFFDPYAMKQKRMPALDINEIHRSFNHPDLNVIGDPAELKTALKSTAEDHDVLLIMSSGNLGGIVISDIFL